MKKCEESADCGRAAMLTKSGAAEITINPNASSLFVGGNVDVQRLAELLTHEARHIYDIQASKLYGGPKTIEQVRMTERNTYRTQASYLEATGLLSYTEDLSEKIVLLTREAANFQAEESVKSWTAAPAAAAKKANIGIDDANAKHLKDVAAANAKRKTHVKPDPKQPYFPVPVYSPPKSYADE